MKINFSEVNSKILKLQFKFEMETAKIRKELKTEIADLMSRNKNRFLRITKVHCRYSQNYCYSNSLDFRRHVRSCNSFRCYWKSNKLIILFLPKKGLEPPQPCGRWHLKPVRLPIPPLRRFIVRNCSYNFDRFSFSVIHYFGIH